jgi:predicted porin
MSIRKPVLAGCVVAAALCASGSAFADSSVELYGQVDAWMGAQKNPGAYDRSWTQGGGGMSTSYWGLKGSEDLSGGLKTVFALEDFYRPQTGSMGRYTGDAMFSRNAYVGLQSDALGKVTIGRLTTPYFVSAILFNPFVDSYTFSPMVFHTYMGMSGQGVVGDSGWNQSVMYSTPSVHGLSANVIYGFSGAPNHSGQNKWGANALYFHGPFSATVAYQQVDFDSTPGDLDSLAPGFRRQQAAQAGAAYDFGFAKLFAQYQYIRNVVSGGDVTMNGGQAGVSVPLGNGKVMASYAYTASSGASDVKRNTWALGYDYTLSKRTDVYAAYFSDKVSDLSRGDTFGVGIRSKF